METPPVDDTAIPDMQPNGALDVAGHILHSLGVQSLSGIKGLSALPDGADAAAQAISDYQDKFSPKDLSPEGQQTIRDTVAPIYRGVQDTFHTKDLSAAYGEGSEHLAGLAGKYLGAGAAGVVGTAADLAPMMITDGGLAAGDKSPILGDVAKLIDKYAPLTKKIQETGGITYHPGTGTQPTSGYAVSLHKGREVVLPSAPDAMELARYTHANQDAFDADPGAHVGVWNDPPGSGQHFMDVSHVEPDFQTALQKAKANDQLGIFDLANKETIPTDGSAAHFLHMSNLSDPRVTLDPKFYGTGLKGREAKRGGTKVTSLYPADIAPKDIETGLQNKTPYRVSVPAHSMYDLSADPEGHLSNMPDFGSVEDAVKDAGYAGYHVPGAEGLLRGQGRLFGPHPATRLGPGPAPEAEEDLSQGFAEGGEVAPVLGDLGSLVAKYAPEAEHLADTVANTGKVAYNPTSGELHSSGYAVPTQAARSMPLDHAPGADDIHNFLMDHQDAFDEDPQASLLIHGDGAGNHFMHVAHVTPDLSAASGVAAQHGLPGFQDLQSGEIHQPSIQGAPSVLTPSPKTSAQFPELASRYPLQTPPEMATDKNSGKQFLQKVLSPEAQDVSKARVAAQQDINTGNYQPYFPPDKRFDVDASQYPQTTDTLGIVPKKQATVDKYAALAGSPDAKARLLAAYNNGVQFEGAPNWYHMGQLEDKYKEVYGPELGPQVFKSHFADAMAATTGGADPTSNLVMAHYGNYLKGQGLPAPAAAHEMPFPIGGRYASGNMDMYNKIMNDGKPLDTSNPKRTNFSANFQGHANRATIDEQMSGIMQPGMAAPPPGTYGVYEQALHDAAQGQGVDPRFFQEVSWAGAKKTSTPNYTPKSMIQIVNEAIERTHRITGMDHDSIANGMVRGDIPLYGRGGSVGEDVQS